MTENNQSQVGGWIEGEILFNPKMNKIDIMIFWIVWSITKNPGNKCFAGNNYFADRIGRSEENISRSISKLIKEGYLERAGFDGRVRHLKINQKYKKEHAHFISKYNHGDIRLTKNGNVELTKTTSLDCENRQLYKDRGSKVVYNNSSFLSGKKPFSTENGSSSNPSPLRKALKKPDRSKRKEIRTLAHWNSKGKPVHKEGTKRYDDIISTLTKQLSKYSEEEITKSIDTYYSLIELSENNGCEFNKKTKGFIVGLDSFFCFSTYNYNPKFDFKSWFQECRQPHDKLIEKYSIKLKNKHPVYTSRIKKRWEAEYQNGREIKPVDENNFILCANKIVNFIETNRKRLYYIYSDRKNKPLSYHASKFISGFFSCLSLSNAHVKHTGFLTQDFMFDKFENFMIAEGLMSSKPRRRG